MPRAGVPGIMGFPALPPNPIEILDDGTMTMDLGNGHRAIFDAEDYSKIQGLRWYRDSMGYAASSSQKPRVRMHRLILAGKGKAHIDHQNQNKLDNRKANIRWASVSENHANRKPSEGKSSPFKGVCWDHRKSRWRATIKRDKVQTHLGYFGDEIEAARAYNEAAVETFGPFARINQLPA